MKSKIVKFLVMLSLIILIIPYSSVTSLKFKIEITKELGRTRINLEEICFAKLPETLLFWSHLVDDKDIFVLNNMIINIPVKSRAIKALQNLDEIKEIPTDYIEDHYYEILDREEKCCNVIYEYLRNHKVIKKLLDSELKNAVDPEAPLAKRRKMCK